MSFSRHLFIVIFTLTIGLSAQAGDPVWVDVRSAAEHQADNIEGDLRVDHSEIVQTLAEQLPDKSTTIRLYCRSGRRASIAAAALEEAGYADVKSAGGIDDARRIRALDKP